MKFKGSSSYWILVAAIAAILWLPNLLSMGMFMDGVYDALFAQNLYKGVSTFWAPQGVFYSAPAYWDNPPFSMWLLSCCYKAFGNHYQVERIYSFACAIVQLVLIALLWRKLFWENENIRRYAWLPCLLWLMSPLIGWCYSNNLMENTMSLFTTAALIICLSYVTAQRQLILRSVFTAAFLLLAFITKGPVALFPLAFPVLLIGIDDKYNIRKGIGFTILTTAFFCLFFTILFSFEAPGNFLHNYFDVQLKRALNHDMPIPYKPYQIFIELLAAASPFIALSAIRLFMKNKLIAAKNNLLQKAYWRLLLLALCGSLPIALSVKQRSFYLLPAMIPLVIGFAAYLLPLFEWAESKTRAEISSRVSMLVKGISVSMLLLSVFLCFNNRGVIKRDQDLLHDLKAANEKLPGTERVVHADWSFYDSWLLRGYLLRLYDKKLCLPNEPAPAHFYLTQPSKGGDSLPGNAKKIFSGHTFDLYEF